MSPANPPPRPPLTDEEQRLLTDPDYLAESSKKGPIVFQDRSVQDLDIQDQRFLAVRFAGVDFQNTRLSATAFEQAELHEVTFTACTFDDVGFERSRLERCGFDFCQMGRVRIVDATAADLTLQGCTWKDSVFERAEFQSLIDRGGSFLRSQFRNVRLVTPELRGTRFDHAQIEDVTVAGGTLGGVTFTAAQGRGMLVQSALVDGLDFVLGTWVALTFDQIHGRTLRLTAVSTAGLSLLGCGELVGVAVAGGELAGLAIDRCPTLGLVSFGQAKIGNLMVSDSFIDGAFWQGCTIADMSSIERSCLAGLDLGRSSVDGLAIRDTQLTTALGLQGAQVQGLVLERVSYAPDLVVRADGLSYGPGARFPTP